MNIPLVPIISPMQRRQIQAELKAAELADRGRGNPATMTANANRAFRRVMWALAASETLRKCVRENPLSPVTKGLT